LATKTGGAPRKKPYATAPARDVAHDDPLLTKAEVADLLGVNELWVKRALALGYFSHIKVGRLVRIRRSDVMAYIEEQRRSTTHQNGQ
jgi:excisionase family DNA binding protein